MTPHLTSNRKAQSGAALISAMLVVTLVATLASVALCTLDFYMPPLLPQRHTGQGGHQGDDQHGADERCAALSLAV